MVSVRTIDMIKSNYVGKRIILGYSSDYSLLQGKLLAINDKHFLMENVKIPIPGKDSAEDYLRLGKLEQILKADRWKPYLKKAIFSTSHILEEYPIVQL